MPTAAPIRFDSRKNIHMFFFPFSEQFLGNCLFDENRFELIAINLLDNIYSIYVDRIINFLLFETNSKRLEKIWII